MKKIVRCIVLLFLLVGCKNGITSPDLSESSLNQERSEESRYSPHISGGSEENYYQPQLHVSGGN